MGTQTRKLNDWSIDDSEDENGNAVNISDDNESGQDEPDKLCLGSKHPIFRTERKQGKQSVLGQRWRMEHLLTKIQLDTYLTILMS